jgi:hypothetical protein
MNQVKEQSWTGSVKPVGSPSVPGNGTRNSLAKETGNTCCTVSARRYVDKSSDKRLRRPHSEVILGTFEKESIGTATFGSKMRLGKIAMAEVYTGACRCGVR